MKAIELGLDETLVFGPEQGQVIEAGFGGWGRDGIGCDLRMVGGLQPFGPGQLQKGVLKPEFEARKIEGVVAQFKRLAAQEGRHLVAITLKRNGGGFGHLALVAMQEGLLQSSGVSRTGGRFSLLAKA